MEDFFLNVKTEILTAAADYIAQRTKAIDNTLSGTLSKLQQIPSFWTGEAASLHLEMFKETVPHMEKVIRSLTDDTVKLNEIAGNYTSAVNDNQRSTEDLPADVIS